MSARSRTSARSPDQSHRPDLRPGVVLQPAVAQAMLHGINVTVAVLRPTLGPTPRTVMIARSNKTMSPEVLDSGGVIARRLVELPDRDADVGAMLARAVIWRTHEEAGDGAATAAVIFQGLVDEGIRWLAAGGEPMALRHHLEHASQLVLTEIDAMAEPITGSRRLARMAKAISQDHELAGLLGEIFDVVGADGLVDIRAAHGRRCDREYNEGMYWPGGVHSPLFFTGLSERRVMLENCAVLLSDLDLNEPAALSSLIGRVRAAGMTNVVILAQRISDACLATLTTDQADDRFRAIAVKAPGAGETARFVALRELAVLTGGRILTRGAGDHLSGIVPDALGRARLAWADRDHFGIVSGKGDPRELRRHIADIRAALCDTHDDERAADLRSRLGRLLGGSATLRIGGATETEIETRKANASRTAMVLRGALAHGVVPGGGAALLACCDLLANVAATSTDVQQRAAFQIVIRALEAPARAIITNAGGNPSTAIARMRDSGAGAGYDVRTGEIVSMTASGIVDSAAVLKTAVRSAIAGAAQTLTIDVIVHRRSPEIAVTPG